MDKKVSRIALAAALAGSLLVASPQLAFTQTANEFMASLSTNVQGLDFEVGRANVVKLQQMGIAAIIVGTERISLEDLLAMIRAAEQGTIDSAALAAYLLALAESTALAVFVPLENPDETIVDLRGAFPTGSEG